MAAVASDPGPFVLSPYIIAELDYLVATRRGLMAELAVLRELGSGAWSLAALDETDLSRATEIVQRYGDQHIGLADASLVVLADRYRTARLLTLDRRHFQVLRSLKGDAFTLLPTPT